MRITWRIQREDGKVETGRFPPSDGVEVKVNAGEGGWGNEIKFGRTR